MNVKNILSLAIALSLSAGAFAQQAGPRTGAPTEGSQLPKANRGKQVGAELLQKLNLTEEQKAKFKAHAEETKQKMESLRASLKDLSREEKKSKLAAFRKANQEFIKQTLTKEQYREFQKLRTEKMKELQQSGKLRRG